MDKVPEKNDTNQTETPTTICLSIINKKLEQRSVEKKNSVVLYIETTKASVGALMYHLDMTEKTATDLHELLKKADSSQLITSLKTKYGLNKNTQPINRDRFENKGEESE